MYLVPLLDRCVVRENEHSRNNRATYRHDDKNDTKAAEAILNEASWSEALRRKGDSESSAIRAPVLSKRTQIWRRLIDIDLRMLRVNSVYAL